LHMHQELSGPLHKSHLAAISGHVQALVKMCVPVTGFMVQPVSPWQAA